LREAQRNEIPNERFVMHIYRVQDKDGRGPWRPGLSIKWVEDRPDHDNLKPYMMEWPEFNAHAEINNDEHCGCGCTTVEQLRRWFTETEYNRLRILGFKAVKMNADRILRSSEKQTVFTRKRALRKGATVISLYA